MTGPKINSLTIELVEKIKHDCDRYRELCVLGKDEEGTRVKNSIVKDIGALEDTYTSLSADDRKIVDEQVAEAYYHLMDAGRVMTGQIKSLQRRPEE